MRRSARGQMVLVSIPRRVHFRVVLSHPISLYLSH
jgi:hypothetical protein